MAEEIVALCSDHWNLFNPKQILNAHESCASKTFHDHANLIRKYFSVDLPQGEFEVIVRSDKKKASRELRKTGKAKPYMLDKMHRVVHD